MKQLSLLLLLCITLNNIKAQDSLRKDNRLYYGVIIGYGVGGGFPSTVHDLGLSGRLELMAQKGNSTFGLGGRFAAEFSVLDNSNVISAIYSFDGMYGRVYKKRAFNCSMNMGFGYVTTQEKGKLISSDGQWFGRREYEKIKSSTIGFPMSFKAFWVPQKWIAVGGEAYLNINSISSIYALNFGVAFGHLRFKKKGIKRNKHSLIINKIS